MGASWYCCVGIGSTQARGKYVLPIVHPPLLHILAIQYQIVYSLGYHDHSSRNVQLLESRRYYFDQRFSSSNIHTPDPGECQNALLGTAHSKSFTVIPSDPRTIIPPMALCFVPRVINSAQQVFAWANSVSTLRSVYGI